MKNISDRRLLVFLISAVFLSSNSCAVGDHLKTRSVGDIDIKGTFTLILYGCTHSDDLETFAILDKEGDRYILDPYSPNFNYKVKQGIPAKEALIAAEQFINCHSSFQGPQLSRIVNTRGSTIGYEVKPQYLSLSLTVDDVLENETEIYSYKKKYINKNHKRRGRAYSKRHHRKPQNQALYND